MAKLTLDENAQGEAEIWPILFEKAYAEFLLGGWAEMKGGHTAAVWTALTGLAASTVDAAQTDTAIFQQIANAFGQGKQVVLDTKSEFVDPQGQKVHKLELGGSGSGRWIYANHAYVVRDITTDASGRTIIKLFNPWGHHHVFVYIDELKEITWGLEILEPFN